MNKNQQEFGPIPPLQGGAMGFVSGFKGGAFAGSIGGAALMVQAMLGDAPNIFILFSIMFGLTAGIMAGGIIGGAVGILTGSIGATLYNRDQAPRTAWWVMSILVMMILGWATAEPGTIWIGVLVGALLGAGAARISGRDFDQIVARQFEPEDDPPGDAPVVVEPGV